MLAIKGAAGRDVLTILELSEQLLIRHHTAGELVTRLAKQGLVIRSEDPRDGRRRLGQADGKGREGPAGAGSCAF